MRKGRKTHRILSLNCRQECRRMYGSNLIATKDFGHLRTLWTDKHQVSIPKSDTILSYRQLAWFLFPLSLPSNLIYSLKWSTFKELYSSYLVCSSLLRLMQRLSQVELEHKYQLLYQSQFWCAGEHRVRLDSHPLLQLYTEKALIDRWYLWMKVRRWHLVARCKYRCF